MAGVTSFVRAFDLRPSCYQALLDSFRSKAIDLDKLNQLWFKLCLKLFNPVKVNGRIVLGCDGIKAPKEGRRMPAVKLCHQSSTNNSKPEYVMAHSMQMLALLVTRYLVVDLLWRQLQDKVRFILSDHPTRGQFILMTNDWNLDPKDAIRLYHARFGIEMSFKALIHTVGGFGYHFWMKAMDKIKRGSGTQYLHRQSEEYREAIKAKMATYHVYVNLAAIAQGLLYYFAIHHSKEVWQSYGTWMRTIRKDIAPSEAVTSEALRQSMSEFLKSKVDPMNFKKFLSTKLDPERITNKLLRAA